MSSQRKKNLVIVWVRPQTRNMLKSFKKFEHETYDDIIQRLAWPLIKEKVEEEVKE